MRLIDRNELLANLAAYRKDISSEKIGETDPMELAFLRGAVSGLDDAITHVDNMKEIDPCV